MAVVGNRFRNNNERGCKTAVQARKRKFRLPPSLARVDYVHLGLGLSFLKRRHGIVHDLLDLFRETGPADRTLMGPSYGRGRTGVDRTGMAWIGPFDKLRAGCLCEQRDCSICPVRHSEFAVGENREHRWEAVARPADHRW